MERLTSNLTYGIINNQVMPTLDQRTDLPAFFARYQPVIDIALRDALSGCTSSLEVTHRYHMGWADRHGIDLSAAEGKRLRPTMAMLGADAVGGDIRIALPVATALEYIHNFSLIHDDIEDQDRYRHHRPTIWVVWGESAAIVSGNSMLKIADRLLRVLIDLDVEVSTAVQAQRLVVEAYLRMIEGQYLDISFESRDDVTIDEYLLMIERKTGALIETSLHVGGLVGMNGKSRCQGTMGLRRLGYQFGRLFQIRDDILGVWGSDETGKPVWGDILNKKKSLPAIHALSNATGPSAKKIRAIYRQPELSEKDLQSVLEIMDAVGTYDFCKSITAQHWSAAETIIDELEFETCFEDDFRELGEFLVERIS